MARGQQGGKEERGEEEGEQQEEEKETPFAVLMTVEGTHKKPVGRQYMSRIARVPGTIITTTTIMTNTTIISSKSS